MSAYKPRTGRLVAVYRSSACTIKLQVNLVDEETKFKLKIGKKVLNK